MTSNGERRPNHIRSKRRHTEPSKKIAGSEGGMANKYEAWGDYDSIGTASPEYIHLHN